MKRAICYIEVVVIAVLSAVLSSCARPPMSDEVYTPTIIIVNPHTR